MKLMNKLSPCQPQRKYRGYGNRATFLLCGLQFLRMGRPVEYGVRPIKYIVPHCVWTIPRSLHIKDGLCQLLMTNSAPCISSVVDKGITCSLISYFLLHSKRCKYGWSNMFQFVRAHFIQMHVCVFVICYIKNVVKYDFIYTVTENQHSCNFECRFLWSHTSVPGLHVIKSTQK
jgi:hypothetical protein